MDIAYNLHLQHCLKYLVRLLILQQLVLHSPLHATGHQLQLALTDNNPSQFDEIIYGAGAHFSWIIFNSLKSDLERISGHKIILFGKDSMLGQGCNAGIKSAKLNGPDKESFGFVCCQLSKEEIAEHALKIHPIALEPILILINRSNPVKNLSSRQVRDMFSGKITNWLQVGGQDQPVIVVTRLHCKKRPGHWKRILPSEQAFRQQRLNVSSTDDMVQRVSDFPGAIGHMGSTWVFESGAQVKHINIDKTAPTAANIKTKNYPYYRQLSAVTDALASKPILKIINEVQTGALFFEFAKKYELLPLNKQQIK